MAARKKAVPEFEPERPICGSCGEPATHALTITADELHLERSSSSRGDLRWIPGYGNGTHIRANVCAECFRSSVKLDVTAVANLKSLKT